MNIWLLSKFNNYFNRRIIYYSETADYNAHPYIRKFSGLNFNPNDGVNTEFTFNIDPNYAMDTFTPDYMVVIAGDGEIVSGYPESRWFVTEWTRTRGGQYVAKLRRDVIADNYAQIKTAPIFLERGPVSASDPMIFNDEGMSLNQIKKSETLLKDETGKAWIVGYINRGLTEDKSISINIDYTTSYPTVSSLGITLKTAGDITSGGKVGCIKNGNFAVLTDVVQGTSGFTDFNYLVQNGYGTMGYTFRESSINGRAFWVDSGMDFNTKIQYWNTLVHANANVRTDSLLAITSNFNSFKGINPTTQDNFNAVRSLPIVEYDGKYYRISLAPSTVESSNRTFSINTGYPAIKADMQLLATTMRAYLGDEYGETGDPYDIYYEYEYAEVVFTEVQISGAITTQISSTRRKLKDAPYDMFAMEYSERNMIIAQQIAKELSTNIYDIQILPFSPIRYNLVGGVSGYTEHVDYDNISISGEGVMMDKIWYARLSSDSFNINQSISILNRTENEALNKKLSNECDLYRLVGPNYASAMEFSLAKNNGLTGFVCSYTYKPFNPFIYIEPIFSNLYGNNFNDNRGLTFSGDFSISMVTDQWEKYQIENANFQNIFDTKIKAMDTNRNIDRHLAPLNMLTSLGKGIVGGMITGNVAGAAVGAGAGLVSGISGIAGGEAKYSINRQLEIDNFNYNLGNIKALPDTLSRISGYNIINKYFPVLEYYTCSEEELESAKIKFEYTQYKLMKNTTIKTLIDNHLVNEITESGVLLPKIKTTGLTFIKGQVIRLTGLNDEDHMANEIYNELLKGVYL